MYWYVFKVGLSETCHDLVVILDYGGPQAKKAIQAPDSCTDGYT